MHKLNYIAVLVMSSLLSLLIYNSMFVTSVITELMSTATISRIHEDHPT